MIHQYPKLKQWYDEFHSHYTTGKNFTDQLILHTCLFLDQKDEDTRQFQKNLEFLSTSDPDLKKSLLNTVMILREFDCDFLQILGTIAERALQAGTHQKLQQILQQAVSQSQLAVVGFIGAWLALNSGDLDNCIAICECIDEPFASVYTVHGQALLEKAHPYEAIEVLKCAVAISPAEPLAWFQMAKAYHVTHQHEQAWYALSECLKLEPDSLEIIFYMSLIAVEEKSQPKALVAKKLLGSHILPDTHPANILYTQLKLCCIAEDRSEFQSFLDKVTWGRIKKDPKTFHELPGLLRQLHEKQWHPEAKSLLEHLA